MGRRVSVLGILHEYQIFCYEQPANIQSASNNNILYVLDFYLFCKGQQFFVYLQFRFY